MTEYDRAIRGLIPIACGFSGTTPQRKIEIMSTAPLDELYPPAQFETATSALCGMLLHEDGRKTRGAGVDWEN